ncbi:MAG: hypothetical protein IKQ71_05560 [Lachnospiraceae bacterium]|nr:hypothetical protein [Lachnospiraceae bacterium]
MARSGAFKATKKDGSIYYRANITFKGKHISLGSYDKEKDASAAYSEAKSIISGKLHIADGDDSPKLLSLEKCICIENLRDNGIYFKTPIYVKKNYFEYYLPDGRVLKFDRDDLFFYASHKLMIRQGRLFFNDYGSQYGILTRYGIRSYAVEGKDFRFVNGDDTDYRYENILVLNQYMGIRQIEDNGITRFEVKIHVRGYFNIGIFDDMETAAIAYNKAADKLNELGIRKHYIRNYIEDMNSTSYKEIYESIKLPESLNKAVE